MAQEGGGRRREQVQLHHRGGRPPLRGAAHGGGVVPARRLLPQQAAHHQGQGGGCRHVHLSGGQHYGLQLQECLPHRAARPQTIPPTGSYGDGPQPTLACHHRNPGWRVVYLRHRPPLVLPIKTHLLHFLDFLCLACLPAPTDQSGPSLPGVAPSASQRGQRMPGFLVVLRGLRFPAATAAAGAGRTGIGSQGVSKDLHGHTHAHTLACGREGASAPAHPLSVLASGSQANPVPETGVERAIHTNHRLTCRKDMMKCYDGKDSAALAGD